MPKTPCVAPPTPALQATTAEADRAAIDEEVIPFKPAKLHKKTITSTTLSHAVPLK